MKINAENAIKLFFSTPSLQMIYNEAVANSIFAGASEIYIKITIDSFTKQNTLSITIEDNGEGFNDKNFGKFVELLNYEDESRKGIGRLIFLNYFNEIEVVSYYENNKKRSFTYSNDFEGKESEYTIETVEKSSKNTILTMKGYSKKKLKEYNYLLPEAIKSHLISHFYPLFYTKKKNKESLKIKIELKTKESNDKHNFYSQSTTFNVNEMPQLIEERVSQERVNLFDTIDFHYSITEKQNPNNPIIALSVDKRTIPIDVISYSNIPKGYEIVFLLYSTLFDGKSNSSREELTLTENDKTTIKRIFRKKIAETIISQIPKIKEENSKTLNTLNEKYPHLQGYFEESSIGLIDRTETLKEAQNTFFNAQKEILEATHLNDEQYKKSIEISSRLLTEYILYRNIIIKNISQLNENNSESDFHNIIVPMNKTLRKENFINDIYSNNTWLIDDKFMSYTTILSNEEMNKLLKEISIDEEKTKKKDKVPDIAIVFSSKPNNEENKKVDVVIVELKKKGNIGLEKKEVVLSQLKQRARKLVNYYPNKIQRIWLYGLVDFDEEFIRSLKEQKFIEVYSNDKYFYGEVDIIPDHDKTQTIRIPTSINLLSYEAFIKDAENRNSTFLEILKNGLKNII